MGSFLVSCCATNQSISGEDVYVIPIYENRRTVKNEKNLPLTGLDRLTYNTDLYGLLGVIFTGSYHDYGRYDIDWDLTSNQFMLRKYVEYLKHNSVVIEQGENPYHDPAFNAHTIELTNNYQEVWEYIHEAIWEGRLYLKLTNYLGDFIYTKVEYFVAHRDNMDILLDMYSRREKNLRYYDGEAKEFYSKTDDEKAKHLFKQIVEEFKETLEDYDGDNEKVIERLTRRISRSDRIQHFFGEGYGDGANVLIRPNNLFKKSLVLEYIKDYDSYLEIYKSLVKIKNIVISLMYCNVIFRPVYYASQDYSNSMGLRYSYWLEQIHKKNVERFDDERDLDDDEDDDTILSSEEIQIKVIKEVESFNY